MANGVLVSCVITAGDGAGFGAGFGAVVLGAEAVDGLIEGAGEGGGFFPAEISGALGAGAGLLAALSTCLIDTGGVYFLGAGFEAFNIPARVLVFTKPPVLNAGTPSLFCETIFPPLRLSRKAVPICLTALA